MSDVYERLLRGELSVEEYTTHIRERVRKRILERQHQPLGRRTRKRLEREFELEAALGAAEAQRDDALRRLERLRGALLAIRLCAVRVSSPAELRLNVKELSDEALRSDQDDSDA